MGLQSISMGSLCVIAVAWFILFRAGRLKDVGQAMGEPCVLLNRPVIQRTHHVRDRGGRITRSAGGGRHCAWARTFAARCAFIGASLGRCAAMVAID